MEKEKMIMRVEVLNKILEKKGKLFRVEYVQPWKINERKEGFALVYLDSNISPILYNDDFIMRMSDEELIEVMENILAKEDKPQIEDIMNAMDNIEYVKSNLYMRLVSLAKNMEELEKEDVAFIPVEDMAITFYIHIKFGETSGKIRIKNDMLKDLNLTKEEAFLYAKENLGKNYNITDIEGILKECTGNSYLPLENTPKELKVLVVTTKDKDEGAALMLLEKVMEELAKHFSSKFLILPSSIHEFIAVPYATENDIRQCREMVREVNSTVLSPDEYLSDNVFIWKNGGLHRA